SLSWWDRPGDLERRFAEEKLADASAMAGHFVRLVKQILGFPRHLSQHVGGFVITRSPVSTLVPVENAAMPGRTVIQWDKDDIDALGLLKVDILALGILSALRRGFALVRAAHGVAIDLARIPEGDAATYEMLGRADSVGVFQIESRAQMAMLPRLRPRCFYDLVIEVAIVRPGPIQGDMVHPYLRRRQGLEPVEYPNAEVREVLERTLGVPIFQEQVIKLAMVAAGFSGGEADQLRRAMAAWKRNGTLMAFHDKVVDGMLARGHARDFAERLFDQMKGFGDYGFPESHAASFALLAYASAWLKCHYPAAFCCALLNSQPMGFYSPSQLVQDARRHGVGVLPVDVLQSGWASSLESSATAATGRRGEVALRLGLHQIHGLGEATALRIEAARRERPFGSLTDLATRASLDRGELGLLASAGALAGLAGHRRQAHWR
ncbi:MAG: error-prone DNA polymerase, partial [Gammaproteobacteria bacterium]